MEDLNCLREQIDEIDDLMVELFLKRMRIVKKVADYKIKNGMEVLSRTREEQILKKYTENIKDEAEKNEVIEFLNDLMSISRKSQEEIIRKVK